MDLSVIIVNYKTKQLTLQTIGSVLKAKAPQSKMEIILVDNASADNTPEAVRKRFKTVKVIESKTNLGFAGGNNLGLRQAKGRYQLLLNSDTLIQPDTLVKMVDFMDKHQKVGLSTCKVVLFDGRLDPASHRGFPSPWASLTYYLGLEKLFSHSRLFAQYHQGWKDLTTTHQIDCPIGAFFFLRQKALKQVGLLDEKFFMYGEDIDLAFRIKKAGWQIVYTPITKITHLKGASGIKKQDDTRPASEIKKVRLMVTNNFFDAMKIFYRKHYQKQYFFLVTWLVFLGIDLVKTIKTIKIKLS